MYILLVSFSEILKKYQIFYSEEEKEIEQPKVLENTVEDESEKEDEEPFDIASLPSNIIVKIIEKLDFRPFTKLEETSKVVANCYKDRRFPIFCGFHTISVKKKKIMIRRGRFLTFPIHVGMKSGVKFIVEFLNIEYPISSSRLRKLNRLIEKIGIRVLRFVCRQRVLFEADDLENLVTLIKPYQIVFDEYFVPREMFRKSIFDSVQRVNLSNTGFTDKEFLAMQYNSYFYCKNDFVTARGLNQFIKQWRRGEREIDRVRIQFENSFNIRSFEIILEGLDANPLWTPALHEDSLIAKLPLDEFEPVIEGDPPHLYVLWRSDQIMEEFLILNLQMEQFCASRSEDAVRVLTEYLNDQQYHDALGVCFFCQLEVCYHRRKYSTNRIKNAWPKTWKHLMFTVEMSKWVLSFLCYSKIVLGSLCAIKRAKMDDYRRHIHEENPRNWIHRNWLYFEFLAFNT